MYDISSGTHNFFLLAQAAPVTAAPSSLSVLCDSPLGGHVPPSMGRRMYPDPCSSDSSLVRTLLLLVIVPRSCGEFAAQLRVVLDYRFVYSFREPTTDAAGRPFAPSSNKAAHPALRMLAPSILRRMYNISHRL